METIIKLFCFLILIQYTSAYFLPKYSRWQGNHLLSSTFSRKPELEELMRVAAPVDWVIGENVPPEIARHNAIYDMILVERLHDPPTTSVGLFIPKIEGKDKKRLGKVLSIPTTYGLESENGRLQPIQDIAPYKVGDLILIKDPWGVGPLNFEVGRRFFSFHKAEHILGVVKRSS